MGFDNERDLGYSRTKGPEGGAYSALPIFTEYFKRAQPADSVPSAPITKPADVYRAANSYGLYDYVLPGSSTVQDSQDGGAAQVENTGTDSSSVSENEIF